MVKTGIKDLYAHYQKGHKNGVNYVTYAEIIRRFNKRLLNALIEGEAFVPGHYIGTIQIKRIMRNHAKPTVDWGATDKLNPRGTPNRPVVFYESDYYCRFWWNKSKCVLPNKSVYSLRPLYDAARTLSRTLKTNPFTHLNYELATRTFAPRKAPTRS